MQPLMLSGAGFASPSDLMNTASKFYSGVLGSKRSSPYDPSSDGQRQYKDTFANALDEKVVPQEVAQAQFVAQIQERVEQAYSAKYEGLEGEARQRAIVKDTQDFLSQNPQMGYKGDITIRQFVNNRIDLDRTSDGKYQNFGDAQTIYDQLGRYFANQDVAPEFAELGQQVRQAIMVGLQEPEDEMMRQKDFEERPGTSMFGETYRSKKNIPTDAEGTNLNRRRVFNFLTTGEDEDTYTGPTSNLMRLPGYAFGEVDTSDAIGQELNQNLLQADGNLKTKSNMFMRGEPDASGKMPPKRARGTQFNPVGLSRDYYEGAGLPNYESESKLPLGNAIGLIGGEDPTQGVAWWANKMSPSRQVIQRQYTEDGENSRPLQSLVRTYGKTGIIPGDLNEKQFRIAQKADKAIEDRSEEWWARNESTPIRAIRTMLGGDPNKYQSPFVSNMTQLPSEFYNDPSLFLNTSLTPALAAFGKTATPFKALGRQFMKEELPEEAGAASAMSGPSMMAERDKLDSMGDVGRGDENFAATRDEANETDVALQNEMNKLSRAMGVPMAQTGGLSPEPDEFQKKKKFDTSDLFQTQF